MYKSKGGGLARRPIDTPKALSKPETVALKFEPYPHVSPGRLCLKGRCSFGRSTSRTWRLGHWAH